jgi:SAM-dependent methyltransferase
MGYRRIKEISFIFTIACKKRGKIKSITKEKEELEMLSKNSMLTIQSPVTGSENVVLEEMISSSKICHAYLEACSINVEEYFLTLDAVSIYKCLDTNYRFFYPFTMSGDGKFYEDLQKRGGYYQIRHEHEAAKEFIKPGDKVLEVGCGNGFFLKELNQRGASSQGLEFNDAAINTCHESKLTVLKEDINSFSKKHLEEYDVVCSFQVLEHISDVHSFIHSSLQALKSEGRLIIGVPNNNPFLYKNDKYHALNLPPHHLGLWNRASLTNLEKFFPMKVESMLVEPLHESEYEHYFNLSTQFDSKKLDFQKKIFEILLMKLRPKRLRHNLRKIVASYAEGRNILAVYTKL